MNDGGRYLIAIGAVLIIIGLVWGSNWFRLGSLPGDFVWRRGGLTIWFPFSTMLLLSLLLSLLLTLLRR